MDDDEEPSQRSPRLDDAKGHDEDMRGDEECQRQDVRKEGTTTRASADDEEARKDSGKDRDQTPEEPVSKET